MGTLLDGRWAFQHRLLRLCTAQQCFQLIVTDQPCWIAICDRFAKVFGPCACGRPGFERLGKTLAGHAVALLRYRISDCIHGYIPGSTRNAG